MTCVCEDDNRDALSPFLFADLGESFVASHFGHLEVEEDDVREEIFYEVDARAAVVGDLDVEAFGFELHAVHLVDRGIVLYDGDFCRCSH